ncbi:MAG: DinB family protein [Gemmatimonadales bacterium]
MRSFSLAALAVLMAAPAAAQQPTAVGVVRPLYELVRTNIQRSAEMVPEADYSFRPTEAVRTFGQLFGHVVNARYMLCSMVKGEENPVGQNFEEVTAKADLVAALTASAVYCDGAYAISDARGMEPLTVFRRETSRLGALVMNATHDWEHYGNLVTYMRIRGMVPPSSM